MRRYYYQQYRRCNRPGCKSCPHGPYWYCYERINGRLRSHYCGRYIPDDLVDGGDDRHAIFYRATATEELARRILGVPWSAGEEECRAAKKRKEADPLTSKAGDPQEYALWRAAWDYLCRVKDW